MAGKKYGLRTRPQSQASNTSSDIIQLNLSRNELCDLIYSIVEDYLKGRVVVVASQEVVAFKEPSVEAVITDKLTNLDEIVAKQTDIVEEKPTEIQVANETTDVVEEVVVLEEQLQTVEEITNEQQPIQTEVVQETPNVVEEIVAEEPNENNNNNVEETNENGQQQEQPMTLEEAKNLKQVFLFQNNNNKWRRIP